MNMVLVALLLAAAIADPTDLARADALVGQGKLAEAEAVLVRSVQTQESPEALVRLSRLCRWTGRPRTAKGHAERAYALLPDAAGVRSELALALTAVGQVSDAQRLVRGSSAEAEPEVIAAIDRARAPTVSASATAYSDSNGLSRVAPRLAVEWSLPMNLRLRLGGGVSALDEGAASQLRTVAGASLSLRTAGPELTAGWVAHLGEGVLHEAFAGLTARPGDATRFSALVRRRPFFESAPTLGTDEATFFGAGTSGAVTLSGLSRRGVDELIVAGSTAPLRATYVYLDARAFTISDGNLGWSASTGAGLDLSAASGLGPKMLSLTLRWDAFATGFSQGKSSYFSPQFLDSHSPGAAIALRPLAAVRLVAEAGPTLSFTGGQTGYFAGAGIDLEIASTTINVRAQLRDDPWFASKRAWLSVTRRL